MNIFNKLASLFPSKTSTVQQEDKVSGLHISHYLKNFLENEVLNGLDISSEDFWSSFEKIGYANSY
jgi:hypothetical protein